MQKNKQILHIYPNECIIQSLTAKLPGHHYGIFEVKKNCALVLLQTAGKPTFYGMLKERK